MKRGRLSLGQQTHHKDLPNNFQEKVILTELELKNQITVSLIKKLSFLYSLAIEHYDSVNQNELLTYYITKMNNLLITEGVSELLDSSEEDETNHDVLYREVFRKQRQSEVFQHSLHLMPIEREDTVSSLPLSTNDSNNKLSRAKLSSEEKNRINSIVKEKIESLRKEEEKIDEWLTRDIINQKVIFVERKRQKKIQINKQRLTMIKQSICELSNKNSNEKKEEEIEKMKQSNLIKKSVSVLSCNEQSIDRLSNPFKRQMSVGNTQMISEIQGILDKSIKEMHKALDELQESYDAEIKSYECKLICLYYSIVNGLKEFALCLKEERDEAIENLKYQYEEQRERETEKVQQKFKFKKSVCL